ncbi:MAG: polysaccharide deacetylase family protein [Chitinophagales bacterium]|nr:polysaccharide deacetylase family protein [Chitinophagales bacterium]
MYFVRIPKAITYFFPHYLWNVGERQIALTFDDSPNTDSTSHLLHLLAETDCKVTFFLLGQQAEKHPDLVCEIQQQGHAVGHHSFNHKNGWKTSNEEYLSDVQKAYQIIKTPLFRPPYGKITQKKWQLIQSENPDMKCCLFNFMPGDFDEKVNSELLQKRMIQVQGGDIIVLHDRKECLVKYQDFLPQWIKDMKTKGYTFVTL